MANVVCFRLITWFALKALPFHNSTNIFLCVPELSIVTVYSVPQPMTHGVQHFPFPMQGVQSAFQALQFGNHATAATAAHQSQQPPAPQTLTPPMKSSAGVHSQYSTGPGVCLITLTTADSKKMDNRGAMKMITRSKEGFVTKRIFYDAPVEMLILSVAGIAREGVMGSKTSF